uniref:NAC domain-containing protein n=1 Tax=Oryza barthii TaxID=65489 RepID=A0A0D3FQW3_9ORYZ
MADDDEIALEPGYVFHPSDDGLITLFLRPSIAKIPFEDRLINHADVYSADPAELVGEHRPAPGTHGSSSVWLGWCMTEYGLDDDAIDGADKQVLCKVYRSPRAVCAEARTAAAAKSADSPCSGSKRKADDGADHPEAPPSARPRQEEAGSEHGEQPAILPELDLDALLSAPMDDSLGVEFDTVTTEQYMRYLMNDEPLPSAPTMEVAGGGDEFIETTNGPCMGEEEIIQRLAAGETLDDILGTNPN